MSYLIFDIQWEGGAPLPSEWQLDNVDDPSFIGDHLKDEFGCNVDCFEYTPL